MHGYGASEALDSPLQRSPLAKLPFVRGVVVLWESLSYGMRMLMRSADIQLEDPQGVAVPADPAPKTGMGGNAATQTLTVIVRGLALGELTWNNARKALLKEILVGVGNGIANGIVAGLAAWLLMGQPALGLLLLAAMIINLFVAGMAGTLIPLGLKALKIDPALASTVFITTFTDVCGFASFLGLATMMLRMRAHTG